MIETANVLGLDLARLTFEDTLRQVSVLVENREPAYFLTPNLHYAKLVACDSRVREIVNEAAFLVADGMPLVWASRLTRNPLPCRVAGSDLVPRLCGLAAERGYRVFFLGGGPNVADTAAAAMRSRFPGVQIVGTASPRREELQPPHNGLLLECLHEARPHLLFVALGSPRGVFWIRDHYRQLGPVVCAEIGATFDFLAGRIRRAPRWMRHTGLEWMYRMCREPARLGPRYAEDALFLAKTCLARMALR